jgi:hypothetical protein
MCTSNDMKISRQLSMIKGSIFFAISLCIWIAQPISVSAQTSDVCDTYTIKRGDTLRGIALKFFNDDDINTLYGKNRDLIGSNPNFIFAGAELKIPCSTDQTLMLVKEAEALTEQVNARIAAEELVTEQAEALVAAEMLVAEQASARVAAEELAAEQADARIAAEELAVEQTNARIMAENLAAKQADARADAEKIAAVQKEQILQLKKEMAKQKKDTEVTVKNRKVTLLAANDYIPYTDENLAGQGLITEIVEHAILRINPELAYDIKFVNDRNSHIDTLLPSFAFEASFPWPKPACERTELLTETYIEFCNSYNFSQPLYDIVEGFIARKGSRYETATNYDQFEDARICRTEGFPIDHLLVAGVIVNDRELIRPLRVDECFEKLLLGTVDLISIDIQVAETIIGRLGLDHQITNNKNLAVIKSLHAIAHKDSKSGNDLLLLLDNGVTTIRKSGEWYDIASSRLQDQINE